MRSSVTHEMGAEDSHEVQRCQSRGMDWTYIAGGLDHCVQPVPLNLGPRRWRAIARKASVRFVLEQNIWSTWPSGRNDQSVVSRFGLSSRS